MKIDSNSLRRIDTKVRNLRAGLLAIGQCHAVDMLDAAWREFIHDASGRDCDWPRQQSIEPPKPQPGSVPPLRGHSYPEFNRPSRLKKEGAEL